MPNGSATSQATKESKDTSTEPDLSPEQGKKDAASETASASSGKKSKGNKWKKLSVNFDLNQYTNVDESPDTTGGDGPQGITINAHQSESKTARSRTAGRGGTGKPYRGSGSRRFSVGGSSGPSKK